MPSRFDGFLYGLALATAVASAVQGDATSHAPTWLTAHCSMSILPGARDSFTTTLLGRATADTIAAGAGFVARSIWERTDHAIYGQIIRVDSMLGPGADLARQGLVARHSNEVLIVPWENNPGCGIDVWSRSARWTSPDSSGLFSLRLRPESLWASGRPTFDAFFAANYSYADGPYTIGPHTVLHGSVGAELQANGSMTPAEVFALYAALPAFVQSSDPAAIARLRDWVRANPHVLTRYPGNQILQYWPLDRRR